MTQFTQKSFSTYGPKQTQSRCIGFYHTWVVPDTKRGGFQCWYCKVPVRKDGSWTGAPEPRTDREPTP